MSDNVKEKRKSLIRFWIITICSMVVGGVLGFACFWLLNNTTMSLAAFRELVIWWAPYLMLIVNGVLFFVIFVLSRQCRQLLKTWDQEDDAVYERMERKSGIALGASSANVILTMVLFGISLAGFGVRGGGQCGVILRI